MGYTMSDNICPKCNNEVEEGSKFCPNCGFSLDNQKSDADEIINNFINFKDDINSKIQNKLENEDILNINDIKEMIKNLDEDSLKQLMEKHGISPSRFKLLNFNKLFDKIDINRLKDDLIELGIINPKPDSDVETVKAKVIIEDDDVEEEPQKPQENEVPLIGTDNIDAESSKEETDEKEEIQNDEQSTAPEKELDDESQKDSETEIPEEETVAEDDNYEDEEIIEEEHKDDKESESVEKENDANEEEPSSNSNICSECRFENRPNVKFCTKCGNKLI